MAKIYISDRTSPTRWARSWRVFAFRPEFRQPGRFEVGELLQFRLLFANWKRFELAKFCNSGRFSPTLGNSGSWGNYSIFIMEMAITIRVMVDSILFLVRAAFKVDTPNIMLKTLSSSDIWEMLAVFLGAKENTSLPIMALLPSQKTMFFLQNSDIICCSI